MKNNKSKTIWTIVILASLIGVLQTARVVKKGHQIQDLTRQSSTKRKGNIQAPVHIIEFSDFQCPACVVGARMLNSYIKRYPEQIKSEFYHFPYVAKHRHAFRAATYAECALQQDKFWEIHDALFFSRRDWANAKNPEDTFKSIAKNNGLDNQQFSECLNQQAIEQKINEDIRKGNSLGFKATPSYVVNGKIIVGHRRLKETLDEIFKREAKTDDEK